MAGSVKGLEQVVSRLNAKVKEIEGKSMAGLYKAGLLVQRTSQKRTPRDTGNLRASAYTRKDPLGRRLVEVGYTAKYAAAVHENLEQKLKGQPRADFGTTREGVTFGGGTGKGRYWDTGQPKFLESALHDEEAAVFRLIRGEAAQATR